MADDRLRIVAEVTDQFTGPLAKFDGALRRSAGVARQASGEIKKDFEGFHGVLGKTNEVLRGLTAPLSAFGIASGGAALSVAAIGGALSKFSASASNLSNVSKNTGIAVDSLRALAQMGERVGISGETMLSAADNFARAGAKLKRGWGEAMQELPAMGLSNLLNELQSAKSAEDMMGKLLTALPKISNIEARRRVGAIFFGTEDIDKIITEFGSQAASKFEEIRARIGTLGPESEKAAKEFKENLGKMGDAYERLKVQTFGPILKGINKGIELGEREYDAGPLTTRQAQVRRELDVLGESKFRKQSSGDEAGAAETQRRIDRLNTEMQSLTDQIRRLREQGATVQQQSFNGSGGGGEATFQRAGFGGGGLLWGGPRGAGGGGGGLGGPGGFGGVLPSEGPVPSVPSLRGGGSGGGGRASPPLSGSGPADTRLPSRGPLTGGQREREQRAIARLIEHGWNPVAAATAVGQAVEESQVRSDGPLGDTRRFGTGDAAAHGMFQWRDGRFRALKAFAEERGKPWTDFETQVDFFNHEQKRRGTSAERNWHNETEFGRGNQIGKLFEGYSGGLQPQREAHARRVYRDWQNGGGRGGSPAGASPAGTSTGLDGEAGVDLGNGTMRMPNGAIRSRTYGPSSAPPVNVPGSGERPGDQMMRRLYGDEAPVAKAPSASGRMDIHLHGFPQGTRARVSMDDLFKETAVSKHRAPAMDRL